MMVIMADPFASPSAMRDRAHKAGLINRTLKIGIFEPELTRIAVLEQHPMAWIVEVDGLLVDARMLPPELQDEARRLGPIPDLGRPGAAA
jgi:hypothetical protein